MPVALPWIRRIALTAMFGCWVGCGSSDPSNGSIDTVGTTPRTDTSGTCTGICDASTPSFPSFRGDTAWGDVTTYGGTDTNNTSNGGACNYGSTALRDYAAIQVDRLPGDGAGQWNGGKVCGQGVRVRARTDSGWKEVFVRVTDKCPDAHCGIDLGGAPAFALMGTRAGRYSGEWTFVSCQGHPELFDGAPRLWTKEGTNAWWSLIQVRDPRTAVAAILWRPADSAGNWRSLAWATEAENFFKASAELLSATDSVDLRVRYVDSTEQSVRIDATDLKHERMEFPLR
jgi:expansin (peptidoglycan-binding protein)